MMFILLLQIKYAQTCGVNIMASPPQIFDSQKSMGAIAPIVHVKLAPMAINKLTDHKVKYSMEIAKAEKSVTATSHTYYTVSM